MKNQNKTREKKKQKLKYRTQTCILFSYSEPSKCFPALCKCLSPFSFLLVAGSKVYHFVCNSALITPCISAITIQKHFLVAVSVNRRRTRKTWLKFGKDRVNRVLLEYSTVFLLGVLLFHCRIDVFVVAAVLRFAVRLVTKIYVTYIVLLQLLLCVKFDSL